MSKELNDVVLNYESYILQHGIDEQIIDAYLKAMKVAYAENDVEYFLKVSDRVKQIINEFIIKRTGGDVWALEKYTQNNQTNPYELVNQYYEVLKYEARFKFESFIYYMEKNRNWRRRFYQPRRNTLKVVAEDLERLERREFEFYGLSMPSRVGKSTICIFFLAWIALKNPNSHSAMGGHSGILAKGFFKELLNLMTTAEYTFGELFSFIHPKYNGKAFPTDKSADEFTITLGDPDRFATDTCRGIDGTWTGAVDVSADGYLYVDDLVRDREHSLSPSRMENTFQEYLNKMVDRKNDGARELMVGTLWNVLDPLERLRKQYEGDSRYFFRKIPALNEKDESNFAYEINGFSTQYYRDMRDKLDKAEWEAKFMQSPYVREGLLFPAESLQYFDGNIPEELVNKEHKIVALCDPAFGGADSFSMPVVDDYGDKDKFIIDWVHKKGTQAVTVPLVVDMIIKHYIVEIHIEQNSGGKLITDSIKAEMTKRDVRHCKIVPYYASVKLSKDAKITGYSDWVKENFKFLMPKKYISTAEDYLTETKYIRSEMYQKAMDEVEMYSAEGKNPHDDAPDTLASLAKILDKKKHATAIIQSPI